MTDYDLPSIAAEINARADAYEIGKLQEFRREIKHLAQRPGRNIFSAQTIHEDWAFHHGGRKELQFNIGKDGSGGAVIRHGVAFSFETSQSLPKIDVLVPKVRRFGEFLRLHSDLYQDMRMWHWRGETRSSSYMPGPIAPELVKNGIFVFLGKRYSIRRLDYDVLLRDFDRLLPLYRYVESDGESEPVLAPVHSVFAFVPGCTTKAVATKATYAVSQLDVTLRHNLLQEALHRRLVRKFGAANVGTELETGVGTKVDLVVRRPNGYWFYEIKTAHSPRACIREAIGQLLEYSFWPGAQEARRLIIVGESPMDLDAAKYLQRLKRKFSIPIHYEQITIKKAKQ